jgi:hypothetical protein
MTEWDPITIVDARAGHSAAEAKQVTIDVILDRAAPPEWHAHLMSAWGMTTGGHIRVSTGDRVHIEAVADHIESVMGRIAETVDKANTWFAETYLPAIEAKEKAVTDKRSRDEAYTEKLNERLRNALPKRNGE